MERMIATCGIVCSECKAYVATQANDRAALERMAARAREEHGIADATAELTMCDGCLASAGHLSGYCLECRIRACGAERGVPNCAHCIEYACDTLQEFLAKVPDARATLDELRLSL
jgi:hypothetical protein